MTRLLSWLFPYRPPTAHQICVGSGIYFTTLSADKVRPACNKRMR